MADTTVTVPAAALATYDAQVPTIPNVPTTTVTVPAAGLSTFGANAPTVPAVPATTVTVPAAGLSTFDAYVPTIPSVPATVVFMEAGLSTTDAIAPTVQIIKRILPGNAGASTFGANAPTVPLVPTTVVTVPTVATGVAYSANVPALYILPPIQTSPPISCVTLYDVAVGLGDFKTIADSIEPVFHSVKTFDAADPSTRRCQTAGGSGYMQAVTKYNGLDTMRMEHTSNVPVFWEYNVVIPANRAFNVRCAARKSYTGGTVKLQVIDPAADPLDDAGNDALAETSMVDTSNTWIELAVAYGSTVSRPVTVRCTAQHASGSTYFYLGYLDQIMRCKRMEV